MVARGEKSSQFSVVSFRFGKRGKITRLPREKPRSKEETYAEIAENTEFSEKRRLGESVGGWARDAFVRSRAIGWWG